jgi:hypothetical protein
MHLQELSQFGRDVSVLCQPLLAIGRVALLGSKHKFSDRLFFGFHCG